MQKVTKVVIKNITNKLSNYSQNEKTETITARINKKTLDKIRSYAKTESTTINSAINQLLSHAVDWDIVSAKVGWIPVPKDILIAYFDSIEDNAIMKIAETCGKSVPKDMLLSMRGKIDVSDWISILRSRARAAGFHFNEFVEGENIRFVMKHDMGLKWSIYFQTYYDSAFKSLGATIDCSVTNNAITYTIDKKYYNPEISED